MYLPPPTLNLHLNTRSPTTLITLPRSEDSTCGFPGNPDVYGIGIRLGIYSQILAVYIANYFLLSEARLLRDAISIFTIALLAVSLIYASNPSAVHAVEGFILLQILAWCCMMGVRVRSSYTRGVFSRGSLLRKIVGDVVNLVNVCLHVWFWWVGVGQMKETPCGTWLMMYVVKTSLFGWARRVMMGLSVFVLVCTVYWVAVEFLRTWSIWRIQTARKEFSDAVRSWGELKGVQDVIDTGEQEGGVTTCAVATDVPKTSTPLNHAPKTSATGSVTLTPTSSALPEEPPSSRPTISNPGLSNATQILHSVYQSELYIQHCISATPYQRSSDGKLLPFTVIVRSIFSSENENTPSWFQCYLHTWSALFTFTFPTRALAVYLHLRQAHLMDPLNGPLQMYTAMTYELPPLPSSPSSPRSASNPTPLAPPSPPNNKLPSWQSVSVASTLLLNAPETPKKVWLGWYYAILDLVIHTIVILQLELTLYWNNVSGPQVLWSNVGQLIPFIVGVGGLGLVLGRWAERWWGKKRKGKEKEKGIVGDGEKDGDREWGKEKEKSGEMFGLEKDVREGYGRWKERYLAESTDSDS